MFSHLNVEENQNPALIIANGAECGLELLGELMESSSIIIVLDSAMERVEKLGIKVDVILGDFDRNFNPEQFKSKQSPIDIVHIPNQDKTDLEKAFEYLIERKIKAVNVIWATGKRADHTINNISSIVKYRKELEIKLLDDHSKIYLLPYKFEKWYPANTIISLIPIDEVKGVNSKNLFYPLENDTLSLGYKTSSSNHVSQDGIVTITHKSGNLLLMECFDDIYTSKI